MYEIIHGFCNSNTIFTLFDFAILTDLKTLSWHSFDNEGVIPDKIK